MLQLVQKKSSVIASLKKANIPCILILSCFFFVSITVIEVYFVRKPTFGNALMVFFSTSFFRSKTLKP